MAKWWFWKIYRVDFFWFLKIIFIIIFLPKRDVLSFCDLNWYFVHNVVHNQDLHRMIHIWPHSHSVAVNTDFSALTEQILTILIKTDTETDGTT